MLVSVLALIALKQPVSIKDIDGKPHTFLAKGPITALIFLGNECPVSNEYAPEIKRIVSDYKPKGVSFFAVYPEVEVTVKDARQHLKDYGLSIPAILDGRHLLTNAVDATRVPEVAVFDKSGTMRYRGRINNLYVSLGNRRPKSTVNDFRDALEAVILGRVVKTPRTAAMGCVIPR